MNNQDIHNESEHARTIRLAKEKKIREEAERYRKMIGLDKKKKEYKKDDVE